MPKQSAKFTVEWSGLNDSGKIPSPILHVIRYDKVGFHLTASRQGTPKLVMQFLASIRAKKVKVIS